MPPHLPDSAFPAADTAPENFPVKERLECSHQPERSESVLQTIDPRRRFRVQSADLTLFGTARMMDLFQQLSDDQLALLGCVVALVSGGLLLQLCYTFGPAGQKNRQNPQPQITKLPQPLRRADDRAA